MTIKVGEAIGAAQWASYLVNGDESEMEPEEKALCDKWQESLAPAYVVDVKRDDDGEPEEPSFTWSYGLHTGDDCAGGTCLTYVTHSPADDDTGGAA